MQVCTGDGWGATDGNHINLKGYSETEAPFSNSCSMALLLFSRSFFLKLCLLYGALAVMAQQVLMEKPESGKNYLTLSGLSVRQKRLVSYGLWHDGQQ
jgi:hypothetical protein